MRRGGSTKGGTLECHECSQPWWPIMPDFRLHNISPIITHVVYQWQSMPHLGLTTSLYDKFHDLFQTLTNRSGEQSFKRKCKRSEAKEERCRCREVELWNRGKVIVVVLFFWWGGVYLNPRQPGIITHATLDTLLLLVYIIVPRSRGPQHLLPDDIIHILRSLIGDHLVQSFLKTAWIHDCIIT